MFSGNKENVGSVYFQKKTLISNSFRLNHYIMMEKLLFDWQRVLFRNHILFYKPAFHDQWRRLQMFPRGALFVRRLEVTSLRASSGQKHSVVQHSEWMTLKLNLLMIMN